MHPVYSAAAAIIGALVLGVVVYFSNRETPQQHSHSGGRPRSRPDPDNWDWRSNNNLGDGESCVICLEALEGTTKVLRCLHRFHSHCISRWFEMNNGNQTCPLCRIR